MVLDPIPQSLPVHFYGSRPQPPTSHTKTRALQPYIHARMANSFAHTQFILSGVFHFLFIVRQLISTYSLAHTQFLRSGLNSLASRLSRRSTHTHTHTHGHGHGHGLTPHTHAQTRTWTRTRTQTRTWTHTHKFKYMHTP